MHQTNKCEDCGKEFQLNHWYHRYCSVLCRIHAHRKRKKEANHQQPGVHHHEQQSE